MDDLLEPRRKKKEWLDPRLGPEIRNDDLQKHQQQGKIPGMILKGVVLALAVALLPLLQKQSNMNHTTVGRSWELINLVVVGLVVSYGVMARRPEKAKDSNDDNDESRQGAHNYVQKMFEIAGVFDDFKTDGVRDKVEAWSSRWQPEEPLVLIAGDDIKKKDGEKPILLPVRSLKSSLSSPDVFDFLNDGKVGNSKPVSESRNEVRNGELLTVESGNFEEQVDHVMSVDGVEPAVFPSPIPWALRRDVLSGGKEPHQPGLVAENLGAPVDGKMEHLNGLRAIPSPIPWNSRPNDGKQKNTSENPNVSEGKPPLPPSQRIPPPPPPPPRSVSVIPSPSPSPRPSPPPSRQSSAEFVNGGSQKNVQTPPKTPPQKLSSPRPSPSPPRPRNPPLENGSSQKQTNPTAATTNHHNLGQTSAKEIPPPPPPPPTPVVTENGFHAKNGSSQNNHANGDVSRHRESKDGSNSASFDEVKPRKASTPSPAPTPPLSPATSGVFEESQTPRKSSENGVAHRSDSRSKNREDSSHRSDSRSKSREGSSHRSDSRSKIRDASSQSQQGSREVEIDSDVLKQKSKDTDIPPRMQSEKLSRKAPPPPAYADVPLSNPLPPPPPPPYPDDEPTSDNITSSPSLPKDEDHTAFLSDDLKHEEKTSFPSKVMFEVGSSDSEPESEPELDHNEDNLGAGQDEEVDKKADQFIAKFHEQIRLQRMESVRRSQKRL